MRLHRLAHPLMLRTLLRPVFLVLAGVAVGLALELAIQLFGALVVPDAFEGFPVWYGIAKSALFQLAAVLPAMITGALAGRHAGRLGAVTAITCALAVDIAFHGATAGSVAELVSPLGLAAGAGILGAVCGWAGASVAQRWRARRAATSSPSVG